MARAPKLLVWIGDNAWVDPSEVIAVDAYLTEDDPLDARVRIILSTDRVIFGMREPERVVQAIRHPELEDQAEETPTPLVEHPESEDSDEARRRRRVRHVPAAPEPLRPRPAPRRDAGEPAP